MASQITEEKTRFPLIPVNCPVGIDFTEDIAATFAVDMSLIHNVFIRALNSIHQVAPIIKNKDKIAFAGYCLTFAQLVHEHHHTEEEIIFPFFQTKIDMDHNLEQHANFARQISAFEDYMMNVQRKREVYDGEKVVKLLDDFGDHLVEHLHDEIPTISQERLSEFDKEELEAMFKRLEKHLMKKVTLTKSAVLVITHHNLKEVASWPPIPKPAKWLVRNIAYWRHRRYWKFSPFTRSNKPRAYV